MITTVHCIACEALVVALGAVEAHDAMEPHYEDEHYQEWGN